MSVHFVLNYEKEKEQQMYSSFGIFDNGLNIRTIYDVFLVRKNL